ncbi:hypothetical protein P7C70_g7093, partial [Phenoliferia sp. Uapishka_3]
MAMAGRAYETPQAWNTVTVILYILAISSLSSMITRRTPPNWRDWARIGGLGGSLLLVLWSSVCVIFLAASKVSITYFLLERVHVVHGAGAKRRHSRLYIFNAILASFCWGAAFVGIMVRTEKNDFMFENGELTLCFSPQYWQSASMRTSDRACVTHASAAMALTVLGMEIILNIYLGLLFIIPLLRSSFYNTKIRVLAIKSFVALIIVLACTSVNIAIYSITGAHEIAWVCLASCTLDTYISAASFFILTSRESPACPTPPSISFLDPQRKPSSSSPKKPKSKYPASSPNQNISFTQQITWVPDDDDKSMSSGATLHPPCLSSDEPAPFECSGDVDDPSNWRGDFGRALPTPPMATWTEEEGQFDCIDEALKAVG